MERQVAQALVSASDAALGRIVRLVDTMASRAEIDRVLEQVRPRLRRLRPARPISVNRLLFLPLEGALAAPATWRRGSGQVPRNALAALAEIFGAAAPTLVREITAAGTGHSFAEAAQVGLLGRRLWQGAASAMPAALPASWAAGWTAASGLRTEDYPPLAVLCTGVWRHAGALWDVIDATEDNPPEALIRAALAGPAQEGEEVFAAALALLLARAPCPGTIASIAAGLDPRARLLAGRALDRLIEAGMPHLDAADPAGAAAHVEQLADMLADLETSTLGAVPERRDRLQKLRHQADLACRVAFVETIEAGLLTPLAQLAATAGDAEVMALEATVRDLRRLLLACRRVGTPDTYDKATRAAVEQLMKRGASLPGQGLTRIDLARLVEILGGREAADRLLAQNPECR